MDFVSFQYWLLVLALLVVYYALSRALQNWLLLIASLLCCASADPRYVPVLLVGTLLDYWLTRGLAWERPQAQRKRALWASVACNLVVLAGFKYARVIVPAVVTTQALDPQHSIQTVKHFFPIGLSFYTLQRLSHTLDAYFRVIEPSTSLLDFTLFTSFFPQLAAGPIERARNVLPQLAVRRSFELARFYEATWLIGLGFFKKLFIADNCGMLSTQLFGDASFPASGFGTLLAVYAYAFQIYADFSGYSDIARGSARLFGIDVMQNFAAPYLAENLAQYWQRWHISLSTFLDEYVFRTATMLLRDLGSTGVIAATWITFVLSGLWHGTGLTFLAWGAVHALGLSVYALTRGMRKRLKRRLPGPLLRVVATLVTFHYVCIGYVFFHASDVTHALQTLAKIRFQPEWASGAMRHVPLLALYAGLLVVLDLLQRGQERVFWVYRHNVLVRALCYALMLACVLRLRAPTEQFIYIDF